jgi:hypothetical protein
MKSKDRSQNKISANSEGFKLCINSRIEKISDNSLIQKTILGKMSGV